MSKLYKVLSLSKYEFFFYCFFSENFIKALYFWSVVRNVSAQLSHNHVQSNYNRKIKISNEIYESQIANIKYNHTKNN